MFLKWNKKNKQELEGTRDSAYLRQVIFYRRPLFEKKFKLLAINTQSPKI